MNRRLPSGSLVIEAIVRVGALEPAKEDLRYFLQKYYTYCQTKYNACNDRNNVIKRSCCEAAFS